MRRKEVSNDMIGMEDHIHGFQHFLKCQNSSQCHNMSEVIIIITIIVLIRSVIATIMNIIIFIIIVTILPSMTMTMTSSGCWWWWWCSWWRWWCFLAGLWIHSVLDKHEIRQEKYLSQCALQQLLTGSGWLWLVGFVQIEASQLHRDFRSILGADGRLSLLTCDAENSQP